MPRAEQEVKYNKCVVDFAIRVDKGNNAKAGFDKKIKAALSVLQNYIDKHTEFLPSKGSDTRQCPIKEKADLLAFQVVMRSYFSIPIQRAFNNVTQEGGRVIRGSTLMGFLQDPKMCLDKASGDLRSMAIFYKKCQEVDIIARLILLGAPNTIKEDIIKQMLDEELKLVEQKLLLVNNKYKISKSQWSKWLNYAVEQEFPAGMPWEGAEEKKQKQGTNNACLAYILHVHNPDYKRMKTLLSSTRHKHWRNAAFTVKIPNECSP